MEYSWLWLYLFTRADVMIQFFGATSMIVGIAAMFGVIFGMIEDHDLALSCGKKGLYIAVPALILALAIPSKQDIALIIGGHYALQFATSETAAEGAKEVTGTARKLLELVNQELDQRLSETKADG